MAPPDPDRRGELEFRDYLLVVRRRWLLILVVTAIAIVSAFAASAVQPKQYRATSEVLLKQRVSESIFGPDSAQPGVDATRTLDTELQVLGSRMVKDAVRKQVGHDIDASVRGVGETDVIAISVSSRDPRRAAADANAYATTYVELRREQTVNDLLDAGRQVQDQINVLQAQLEVPALSRAQRDSIESQISYYESQLNQLRVATRLTRTGGVQLLTQATNPSVPFAPQPLRNAAIAAVLGLLLGVALAFAREHLDDTIRSKDDLETASRGLTVVGLIPAVAGWRDRSQPLVVAMNDPASPAAEAYRTLRTSVQFLRVDRPLQVVQITSAEPEEGKTTTAANLAIALARAGERVLLIECDLRRSRLHEFFGLRATPGFTSLLLGDTPVAEAVHQVEGEPRVYVLPSGPTPPNPSELLSSARAREVLTSFRANVDIVIVDSPPVLPVTDAMVLAGVVDATLVVAAAGKTSKRALARAIELLQQVNAPLIGTVLNSVRPRAAGSYGYEYGTGYGYAMKNEAPRIRRRGRRRLGDLRGETLLPRKT